MPRGVPGGDFGIKKDCRHCGKRLARRDGEAAHDWKKRKHCDKRCSDSEKPKKWTAKMMAKIAREGELIERAEMLARSMNPSPEAIGRILRLRREKKQLGQDSVAAIAGVGEQTVIHAEYGRRDFSYSTLVRLAAAVGLTLRGLLERAEKGVDK